MIKYLVPLLIVLCTGCMEKSTKFNNGDRVQIAGTQIIGTVEDNTTIANGARRTVTIMYESKDGVIYHSEFGEDVLNKVKEPGGK